MPYAASSTTEPQRAADVAFDRGVGPLGVDALGAAGDRRRVHVAEGDAGIGHRRRLAAAAVTGGAGIGAGALRPDARRAAGSIQAIEPPPAPTSAMSMDGMRKG